MKQFDFSKISRRTRLFAAGMGVLARLVFRYLKSHVCSSGKQRNQEFVVDRLGKMMFET